jgi:hypothetical protein
MSRVATPPAPDSATDEYASMRSDPRESRHLLAWVAAGGAVAHVSLGMPVAEDVVCPSGATITGTGFTGDGVAGAGAAETVGLPIAEIFSGSGDPGDQILLADCRDLVGEGVPGWDTRLYFRWRGYLLSGQDRDTGEGGNRAGGDRDEGCAGELAAFGQHAARNPGGRAHLGVPVGGRGAR